MPQPNGGSTAVPVKEHIQWQITDPKGKDIDFFEKYVMKLRQRLKSSLQI